MSMLLLTPVIFCKPMIYVTFNIGSLLETDVYIAFNIGYFLATDVYVAFKI